MTGMEIAAVSKVVEAVGQKALGQDETIKGQLLSAAEGTPEMKAAARSMAARAAVKERIKLKLYQPFARMVGVSKAYFEDVFPEEMAARTASIPEAHLITPPAVVAVPAMLGLGYSFGEPDLKNLYLNLLTTAADDRRTDDAHPAFADVIKQLAPGEAKLLNLILPMGQVPVVRVKNMLESGGFELKMTHLLPLSDFSGATELPQVPTWVDNWMRLGLFEVDYAHYLTAEAAYDWITAQPDCVRISRQPGINRLDFDKGVLLRTAFGQRFFRAVGPPEESSVAAP